MMSNTNKWFLSIGSLVPLGGFFLPLMAVSCVDVVAGSTSLPEMAQYSGQSGLYISLLAFLGLAGLLFFPCSISLRVRKVCWVQLVYLEVNPL